MYRVKFKRAKTLKRQKHYCVITSPNGEIIFTSETVVNKGDLEQTVKNFLQYVHNGHDVLFD